MIERKKIIKTTNIWRCISWFTDHVLVRRDTYGYYNNFKNGIWTAHWPLSDQKLFNHFLLQEIVGLHLIDPLNNICKCLVLDIDAHAEPKLENFEYVCAVADLLSSLSLDFFIEHSNGLGGYHIWIPFEAQDVKTIKNFGYYIVQKLLELQKKLQIKEIEVFPKQEKNKPFGFWIRLPGRHPRKNWISSFLDKDLQGIAFDELANLLSSVKANKTDNLPVGDFIPKVPERKFVKDKTTKFDLWDDFNINGEWCHILLGWTDLADNKWARPGVDHISATTNEVYGLERLYCFSSEASPFIKGEFYDKAQAYILSHCNGDAKRAYKELRAAGFGPQKKYDERLIEKLLSDYKEKNQQ